MCTQGATIYSKNPEIPGGNVNGKRFYRFTKWKSSTENGKLVLNFQSERTNGIFRFGLVPFNITF